MGEAISTTWVRFRGRGLGQDVGKAKEGCPRGAESWEAGVFRAQRRSAPIESAGRQCERIVLRLTTPYLQPPKGLSIRNVRAYMGRYINGMYIRRRWKRGRTLPEGCKG